MKISLICIGKTGYEPFRTSIERYAKRIPHYMPFEIKEIPDIKNTKGLTEEMQKEQEGASLLNSLVTSDYLVLLDEHGQEFTSREFSKFISGKMVSHSGRMVFAIGGPYGFAQKVYSRADFKISLSKMTFPHEMVRLFFVEQLYRAFSIMRGEPYHHD